MNWRNDDKANKCGQQGGNCDQTCARVKRGRPRGKRKVTIAGRKRITAPSVLVGKRLEREQVGRHVPDLVDIERVTSEECRIVDRIIFSLAPVFEKILWFDKNNPTALEGTELSLFDFLSQSCFAQSADCGQRANTNRASQPFNLVFH
jgi:hypothetical protein